MAVDRVKFQDILTSQVPEYVKDDFPLLAEFLKQYYVSQEYQGGSFDLAQNIDQYVKVEQLSKLKNSTTLDGDITPVDNSITVDSTLGFVENNGLIKVNDEIILYDYKTDTTFEGCTRGFSGVTSLTGSSEPDQLVFETSFADFHTDGNTVSNLNILFLQEFFTKLKKQVTPGFSDRTLFSNLDQKNFVIGADSFYKSKGTDSSFKILFKALYGEDVNIIKPEKFLIKPSNADFRVTKDYVVEEYIGDPFLLQNLTLFQDSTGARGSVTNVSKIEFENSTYYQVSIDLGYQRDINVQGTQLGNFKPAPRTRILNTVNVGDTTIDVDSAVSFPSSGSITCIDVDGNRVNLSYTDKSNNQLLGVTAASSVIPEKNDIIFNDYAYAYIGTNLDNPIRVRVTATLKDFVLNDKTYLFEKEDSISIQTLGFTSKVKKANDWLFNIKAKWDINSLTLVDSNERLYNIETIDEALFVEGYRFKVTSTTGVTRTGSIKKVLSNKDFLVLLNDNILSADLAFSFVLENQLLKGNTAYDPINKSFANIQNVYTKYNSDCLVSSNSIPSYSEIELNVYDRIITFNGSAVGDTLTFTSFDDHGFYTGDSVYYEPESESNRFGNLEAGVYFIRRVDGFKVKLARSKSDLFANNYIVPSGTVTNSKFVFFDFYNKSVIPQKIYREFLDPVNESGNYLTEPGYTGMLINGVEILNYKSPNSIFYGDIRKINVTSGGFGYDVINPPTLKIEDEIGVGATGTISVNGSLERIDILDTGFDYLDTPEIKISGGSGTGAKAEPNLSTIEHSVPFFAEFGLNSGVGLSDNTIGFTTYHKFRDNERVIYDTRGSQPVVGLDTGSSYYVSVVDPTTVKLFNSYDDSVSGINTVILSGYGSAYHNIRSFANKNIVSSIIVTDPGSDYRNNKRSLLSSGISTFSNTIKVVNHGYNEKDIVEYTPGSTPISGISSTEKYYVSKIDEDNISLVLIGSGNVDADYYYQRNVVVDLKGIGDGTLNYEPISVEISGTIGVSTVAGQDFNCKIQPIFRGKISYINLSDGGVGYGASEVINFNRQPNIIAEGGKNADIIPVINNGAIVDVVINFGGSGYTSPPDLIVTGNGSYSKLTPIIKDGSVVDIEIIDGGIDHDVTTGIEIVNAGAGLRAYADLRTWNINLFERNYNFIEEDDTFVDRNASNNSLQLSNLYAPRKLREIIFPSNADGSKNYSQNDLLVQNNVEVDSTYHSPIIGWSYDGNPIYGPYGFSSPSGGSIRQMQSSYKLSIDTSNRPSVSVYPEGFFVEDYIYSNEGDLDEYNGRFCVTPDYPNGTYAYFATFNSNLDNFGPFDNYRRPAFPYLIGNKFKSRPNVFNFDSKSNQVDYDIESNGWVRNSTPYQFLNFYSDYDYIFNPDKLKKQNLEVKKASKGGIQDIIILSEGDNYKVNDEVVFNNDGTGGKGSVAKVSKLKGKTVNDVTIDTKIIEDIEFIPANNKAVLVGYSSSPHGLRNNDIVVISDASDYLDGFEGTYNIGISSERLVLNEQVGEVSVTGLVTYFSVFGDLTPSKILPNDILGIGTEKVKVLNVDSVSSRIRVFREQEGTVGDSHQASTELVKDSRKFSVNVGSITTTKNLAINKELYFDPSESVGIGTTIGNTTSISISNPGSGVTSIDLETRTLYLPNHGLRLNDVLTYNRNGGISIEVWNGVSNSYDSLSDYDNIYAVPFTENTIGIGSNKVGLAETGTYVGVNTDTGLLFFTNIGVGDTHSFTTNYSNRLTATIERRDVIVSTASSHGLNIRDEVFFDLNPTGLVDVVVKYDDYNRRIVFDPYDFIASDVNVNEDSITVSENIFSTGDKIIYTSSSPSGGLENEKMYYVYKLSSDKIKLVAEKHELISRDPRFVDITSASDGTISKINPLVQVNKNNTLNFDLSDPSLSFSPGGVPISAFDLNIYRDAEYQNSFLKSENSTSFEVTKTGTIGVTSDASLKILVSNELPENLWYKFSLDNIEFLPPTKTQIFIDEDVLSHNKIDVIPNELDKKHVLTSVGDTSFTFNVSKVPSLVSYGSSNSVVTYETNSKSSLGPIADVRVFDSGYDYTSLPEITGVNSKLGTGSLLIPDSRNIGNVLSVDYVSTNIGFDYPTDKTLRPTTNLPQFLEMESLSTFDQIGISSGGVGYNVAPDLLVIDSVTNKVINDLDIFYNLGDTSVTILKNTKSLSNTTPTIIPVNNSNGYGISNITYTESGNVVRVYLTATFSEADEFVLSLGEKILVENTVSTNSVDGDDDTGIGYNSSDYGYAFFEIQNIELALGGSGAYVEYSLENYLNAGESPGDFVTPTVGRIISTNHFPLFDITLKKSTFLNNEQVSNITNVLDDRVTGEIVKWKPNTGLLKVLTSFDFNVGDRMKGLVSGSEGIVTKKYKFTSHSSIGAGTTLTKGWQEITGFLNNNLQKIPNNEYYQNFSYSIESKVPYDTWEESVDLLNHTAGFQKFADLNIESIESEPAGIVTAAGDAIDLLVDLVGTADFNCYYDFDSATERLATDTISNEIVLENRILTDYFQSLGNRVLSIDDISDEFNSQRRFTRFSRIYKPELQGRSDFVFNKMITYVKDRIFFNERQFAILSFVQKDLSGWINQYATVYTYPYLGYFDYIEGNNITFNPVKFRDNVYDVSIANISILEDEDIASSTSYGDIAYIRGTKTEIPVGFSTTTIVSLGTTFRSAKVLSMIEDTSRDIFDVVELNLVHDGTDVHMVEYGSINNEEIEYYYGTGIGTYSARIDGSDIIVEFTPSIGAGLTSNCAVIAISDTGVSAGSTDLKVSKVGSDYKSIAASGSPTAQVISQITQPRESGYYFVTVEDNTNNEYEVFELGVLYSDDSTTIESTASEVFTEFGNVFTGSSGIGTIGLQPISNGIEILYTPNPNINVEVRSFFVDVLIYDNNFFNDYQDLGNVIIDSGNDEYLGTDIDITDSFNLTHDGNDIFQRTIDGSDSSIVDIAENLIRIPNHFFVTGEKIIYKADTNILSGPIERIGITPTVVSGIGLTDKLPAELFVVKKSDATVKFALTAEDANLDNTITIDSVGDGNVHTFTATNQNTKSLIVVDNMIQSPLSESVVQETLVDPIFFDLNFPVTGVTSFFSDNLIKIDEEVMRIRDVNKDTGRITVVRNKLGTTFGPHGAGSTVTKLTGTYNIVGNTVHFKVPPFGKVPVITGEREPFPDELDFTGIETSSKFQGRTFIKSPTPFSTEETYSDNYIFDDISNQFTGIKSDFILQVDGNDVIDIDNNLMILINGIYQKPSNPLSVFDATKRGDYEAFETSGITSIRFDSTESIISGYDFNRAALPVGGLIISVGSTEGSGYQPLITAGGTAVISGLGTVSSISIGNSGSGYRSGVQTTINVGVQTYSNGIPNIEIVGTAVVSDGHIDSVLITNGGSGYDNSNPPDVVFDAPLNYFNVPLEYSSSSAVGSGQSATVNIVVSQETSVAKFEIQNGGFGYGPDQRLTVAVGGTTGIPTDPSVPFNEFEIIIERTFTDSFNGWTVGDFEVFDDISDEFDGFTRSFVLTLNDLPTSIRSGPGSQIDVEQTILVFINDVLQKPGGSYSFKGGSIITFSEAPKPDDTVKIVFYKGNGDVDTRFTDVLSTIKTGDTVELYPNEPNESTVLDQDPRVVYDVVTSDLIETNPYTGPGITSDQTLSRPLTWCRQTIDRIVDGKKIGKDRELYEPLIYPASYLIQSIGTGSTEAYFDTVRPLYTSRNEEDQNSLRLFQNEISITSQESVSGAAATATISSDGTVTNITVNDGGFGYVTNPSVSIGSTTGVTTVATATATILSGSVNNISVTEPGGYYSEAPVVLIEEPKLNKETIGITSYEGDYGRIVGFGQTTFNNGETKVILDLYIPEDSYMRDSSYVEHPIYISGLSTGDFFTTYNTFTESEIQTLTTLAIDYNTIVGRTSNFVDCVWQVTDYQVLDVEIVGIGITTVKRIFSNVSGISTIAFDSLDLTFDSTAYTFDTQNFEIFTGGLTTSFAFGNYSWGKVQFEPRFDPKEFAAYTLQGYSGISTGSLIQRKESLKYTDYVEYN